MRDVGGVGDLASNGRKRTKEGSSTLSEALSLQGDFGTTPVTSSKSTSRVDANDPGALDDVALVERAIDDPEAFRTLFRRHVDDVHRFIRRRTSDDVLADDLTAQTFERCWSALPELHLERSSLRPWLFRVASNQITDHFRAEDRRRRREQVVFLRDEPVQDTDAFERTHGPDAALIAALTDLNERHQTVISLRFSPISAPPKRRRRWASTPNTSQYSNTERSTPCGGAWR